MSTHELRDNNATVARVDLKLEVVVIPVSDVDRAKEFYGRLGWRLDADYDNGDDFRVIQFTPPGSACSVIFGKNVTPAASTLAPTSPTCLGAFESAVRIPSIAATARLSPSAIPTATAGCCRKSRSGYRAGV
jgi:catechol 2,3-dioxygenase-like lactoylglutathione lyase family enzyme